MPRPPAPRRPVVVGSVSLDENWVGKARVAKLGGVVTYAGLTLARRGAPATVVTRMAASDRRHLDVLIRAGLTLRVDDSAATTRFENRSLGDDRAQRVSSRAEPIESRGLGELADGAPFVLLGALHEADVAPSVVELLGSARTTLATDVQGFVRAIDAGVVHARASSRIEAVLRASRVVKATRDEMRAIEVALGMPASQIAIELNVDELLITCGSRGGVRIAEGRKWRYAAVPARTLVDPTGAGDVFFASYLHATRIEGREPARALSEAARVAARQVSGEFLASELRIDRD